MLRSLIFCMPLLLASGAAAADGAMDAAATTSHEHAPNKDQPRARGEVKKHVAKAEGEAKKDGAKEEGAKAEGVKPEGDVKMSGISILGNDDAPKSLVIVPWKSSQLGDMPGLSRLLDDSTQPVDKDVFMRELAYYRIKTDSK